MDDVDRLKAMALTQENLGKRMNAGGYSGELLLEDAALLRRVIARIARLEAEKEKLADEWAEEFAKRGHETAKLEREKADLTTAIARLEAENNELRDQLGRLSIDADEQENLYGQLLTRCERLEAENQWRTSLPPNLDECMEIAIALKVGWYRCIGYVLQDNNVTDFDHEYVGYAWGKGCYWRPLSDPPSKEALQQQGGTTP